ncbi:MAG: hypothetical protein F6K10_17470 [Moorea sp. SIO2B7]|nr:hypothetical protein [Moorena sp. SIO2B7]
MALFPYWKGEFSRNWRNSKEIILTIINAKPNDLTLWERLSRFFYNYFELGQQAYFTGFSWFYVIISLIFLSLVLIIGIYKFKGNKTLLYFIGFTSLLYLYAASNYDGIYFIHYKLIILLIPIIFASLSLAYLDISQKGENIITYLIIGCIIFSIVINLKLDYKYLSSKYAKQRLMTPADIVQIFNQLPAKSTICTFDPKPLGWLSYAQPYKYIDKYITKKELNILSKRKLCQSGNYVIYPNYYMLQRNDHLFPDFTIKENQLLHKKSTLFLETPVAKVYLLK